MKAEKPDPGPGAALHADGEQVQVKVDRDAASEILGGTDGDNVKRNSLQETKGAVVVKSCL